jgi:hypothetical protein
MAGNVAGGWGLSGLVSRWLLLLIAVGVLLADGVATIALFVAGQTSWVAAVSGSWLALPAALGLFAASVAAGVLWYRVVRATVRVAVRHRAGRSGPAGSAADLSAGGHRRWQAGTVEKVLAGVLAGVVLATAALLA